MQSEQNIDNRLYQTAVFIEQNVDKTLSLALLAKKSAISPFHLQRKFKGVFGVSPKQFQNALRIQMLKQSLKQGSDISDAIYAAGFGSTSRVYEQVNQSLGMTPSSYKEGGKNEHIAFAVRDTSFGHIIMAATSRGVCFVHFSDKFTDLIQALHKEFPLAELSPTPKDMSTELDAWISALDRHINNSGPKPNVPLDLYGTAFQLKVWKFLISVKDKSHVTYKDVAIGIASPNSFRAAANACGANKVAVLIPCHKVLRGDGQLGGYRWGTERKRRLLEIEKICGKNKQP